MPAKPTPSPSLPLRDRNRAKPLQSPPRTPASPGRPPHPGQRTATNGCRRGCQRGVQGRSLKMGLFCKTEHRSLSIITLPFRSRHPNTRAAPPWELAVRAPKLETGLKDRKGGQSFFGEAGLFAPQREVISRREYETPFIFQAIHRSGEPQRREVLGRL